MSHTWSLFLCLALLICQLSHSFVIDQNRADCLDISDNDALLPLPSAKCSWLVKAKRDVGKYRNFFAELLQEENKDFAYELQEIYNLLCEARDENDEAKKEHLLKYAKWLMESTKKLNGFLLKRGIWKI